MTEEAFVEAVRRAGGRVFLVGGWVRDRFRGVPAHDKDYVVCGLNEEAFCASFPDAFRAGKSFPVYRLPIDGKTAEVAFARRERKTGKGYRGFDVIFDPSVTIEEDLYRRDTTMNSIAMELPKGNLLDPYGGREDIRKGIIRAVSSHFTEDPVRALRAARQSAEFGFTVEPGTLRYMKACEKELLAEPSERLVGELERALRSPQPSRFFRTLLAAGLLKSIFPEIAALIGKTQPAAFHPEGDSFEHIMLVVDTVAQETDDVVARFAGLAHDLGKGTTPADMLPHHYGHEIRGLDVFDAWDARMHFPRRWSEAARFVIREHMRAPRMKKKGKMARLLLDIDKSSLTLDEFNAVIRADSHGLPLYLAGGAFFLSVMKTVSGRDAPEGLQGREIGEWIFARQCEVFRKAYADVLRALNTSS